MNLLQNQIDNKTKIKISRIYRDHIVEKEDTVAVEHSITFISADGKEHVITCSPDNIEEMILGRRLASGEITQEDVPCQELTYVKARDILDIAGQALSAPEELFEATGCAHSCILAGEKGILCHMEDIKRHNALDKALGFAVKNRIPISSTIMITSGRISYDYLEKASNAGVRIIASRAAVTDAAIRLAKEKRITLLGFVREGRANLYNQGKVQLLTTQEEK